MVDYRNSSRNTCSRSLATFGRRSLQRLAYTGAAFGFAFCAVPSSLVEAVALGGTTVLAGLNPDSRKLRFILGGLTAGMLLSGGNNIEKISIVCASPVVIAGAFKLRDDDVRREKIMGPRTDDGVRKLLGLDR